MGRPPKYPLAARQAAVAAMIEGEHPDDLATKFGVAARTLYRWQKAISPAETRRDVRPPPQAKKALPEAPEMPADAPAPVATEPPALTDVATKPPLRPEDFDEAMFVRSGVPTCVAEIADGAEHDIPGRPSRAEARARAWVYVRLYRMVLSAPPVAAARLAHELTWMAGIDAGAYRADVAVSWPKPRIVERSA